MKHASGADTAVETVEERRNPAREGNQERRGGTRFRSLLGFGLGLALVSSFAGCAGCFGGRPEPR
jgi:hypothetical protein